MEQEYQEQLKAATQFILDGAQEAQNFKTGGESYKKAAETYHALIDKTIEIVSKRPEATIPASEIVKVGEEAKKKAQEGVQEAINNTTLNMPPVSKVAPVLKDAFIVAAPEMPIRLNIKIYGKQFFWISLVFLIISGVFCYSIWKNSRAFDGTAESWANRNYMAAVSLYEGNPGAAYDEVMRDFISGQAEMAKEKVIRKENTLAEVEGHREQFEGMISKLLEEVYPSGVTIIDFAEIVGDKYVDNPFFPLFEKKTKRTYKFIYMKVITKDEQKEFRIGMERATSILEHDKWDVYMTSDNTMNSIAEYRAKREKKKLRWDYIFKDAF